MTDEPAPLRIDLDLREVVEEFFDRGKLVSLAKFEIDPDDRAETLRRGYQPVNERAPQHQFERDALLWHRRRYLPVTVRPYFLDGHYLATSLAFAWRRVRLSAVLRWLSERREPLRAEWFYQGDASDGALLVDQVVGFYFTRWGRSYYVKSLESNAFFTHPELPNGFDVSSWINKMMTPCDADQLRALAAGDADPVRALAAVREIEPYLSRLQSPPQHSPP